MGRIHVGTSGYAYKHWRGVLYPPRLAMARWLERYAEVFDTLELNNTFYMLPKEESVKAWRERTPPRFRFVAKGSRYLTHMKRLRDTGAGLENFFSRVTHLESKLHVCLWQLPPQMASPDVERLARFLAALRRNVKHAVEFRSGAWHSHAVCDVLDHFGAAIVEHDLVDTPIPRITGGFRYVRFHGAGAKKYHGRYGRQLLEPWADDLRAWKHEAWVFFNNDGGGHAVRDALDLRTLLRHDVEDVLHANRIST